MAETKWTQYFITEVKKGIQLPASRPDTPEQESPAGKPGLTEYLVWLDDRVIPNSKIYSEVVWYRPGKPAASGGQEHTHPFDEVIAFYGTDLMDPHKLHGELELWLEGEQHILDRTFLAFIPAGMKHGPVRLNKIERPIIHFNIGPANRYEVSPAKPAAKKKAESGKKTEQYIVTRLQHPRVEGAWSPPPTEAKNGRGGRVLFLDNDVVRGSFYLESVWVTPPPPGMKRPEIPPGKEFEMSPIRPHKHDYDEVLCFFGSNPEDIHDLGGEVWFWIEKEKHIITRSTMVYLPAGVEHCPLMYPRVERPMFHFTSFPGGKTYVE